ncbi:tetratricopeptide repeat protein [Kordiimonas lacus]|uniref:Tetratricopeptide repeat-containing protein n=1 Tax=Kordiimonas lacus TaxID=637679 RepID=A0A1G7DC79_9PROT|nr:tetratricopeptide repeat protein [Kordiimonas lacus]SDE49214.1 Tetratricopeptide repeat-containing protein [Kordiimonas lacus]
MKSLIAPAVCLAAIAGVHTLLPTTPLEDGASFSFNPGEVRQNICGPIGSKRGSLFRPDIAHLIASAVQASDTADASVPLIAGLDHRAFPISSKSAEARAYFRQGFALLYGFNHWEAIRAFKTAQMLDPDCAACYWGEAVALGPNINAGMDADANEKALTAIAQAVALKDKADAREQALIDALAVRYRAGMDVDAQGYADAMAAVAAQFPDDQDVATLYAESLMDLSPWDYWERDFTTPKAHIRTALDQIEKVLGANPDHYGAIHLYIHLYEASTMATKAEPYADRLAGLAPGAGHLVHMPGHIYFRIGRYLDSLDTNIDAVAVDKAYLDSVSGSMLYRYGYYPHNVHFVLVSAQMAGDEDVALDYASRLDPLVPTEVLAHAEWIAPIKAAPYFAYAQFGDLDEVLALPDPGDAVPYLKAMWHYARGVKLAEAGDARAAVEQAAIDALMSHEKITSAGIPAASILKLASLTIAGKSAMKAGTPDAAVALFTEAVKVQDSMGYTEPPFWYYAVEQSLGGALFEAGRLDEAEQAFKASLVRHPNSAWSLYGLMRTHEAQGRNAEAAAIEALLKNASRDMEGVAPIRL